MQLDDEVGKVSTLAPMLISKALELFLQSIIDDTCVFVKQNNDKRLSNKHLLLAAQKNSQYDFLLDIIKNHSNTNVNTDNTATSKPKSTKSTTTIDTNTNNINTVNITTPISIPPTKRHHQSIDQPVDDDYDD